MIFHRFFPSEAISATFRVVMTGRTHLLIEQHRGIVNYTENQLSVRLKEGILTVNGSDMRLQEYGREDIAVSGQIKSLEFLP